MTVRSLKGLTCRDESAENYHLTLQVQLAHSVLASLSSLLKKIIIKRYFSEILPNFFI